jgi:SAM-dependent methyltransferase
MSREYTIIGGLADAARLARQAKVMARASTAFLSDLGVGPGWRCLDVGCGDGQVAVELAQRAGEEGRVVGIDFDADALQIARDAAQEAGASIEFVLGDAADVVDRERFDLVYSRLLLSHLIDPCAALRVMVAELRPGGWVATEDLFVGTLRSEPAAAALDWLQQVYGATVRFHGGDPTLGPRLPALMAACGLEAVEQQVVTNRIDSVEDKLFLAQLVRNMRGSILAAAAASESEVDALEAAVEQAARAPETVFYQADVHQVRGRRPA